MDQACQDFHGDQGRPAEQPEIRKHNPIVTEYQSIYSISNFGIKQSDCGFATVNETREREGGTDCLGNSLHATLTYFPIHQFCVCVCERQRVGW